MLLHLYPKPFRLEYGADMVALLEDQLRQEPAWRVCGRAVADLAITIPNQHLETHMSNPPNQIVPMIYAAVAVGAAALAVVAGTSAPVVSLLVALSSGVMAVIAWRRVAPFRSHDATRRWWAFVVAGPVLVAGVVIGAGIGVDAWFLGMFCVFTGLALTAIGLSLGVARLLHHPAPTSLA